MTDNLDRKTQCEPYKVETMNKNFETYGMVILYEDNQDGAQAF